LKLPSTGISSPESTLRSVCISKNWDYTEQARLKVTALLYPDMEKTRLSIKDNKVCIYDPSLIPPFYREEKNPKIILFIFSCFEKILGIASYYCACPAKRDGREFCKYAYKPTPSLPDGQCYLVHWESLKCFMGMGKFLIRIDSHIVSGF